MLNPKWNGSWTPHRKRPDGYFFGRFWAPGRNQEGPNIDPKSVLNVKNHAQQLTKMFCSSSCFSCGRNPPPRLPQEPPRHPKDLLKTYYGGPFPCSWTTKSGQERIQAAFDTFCVDFRTTIKRQLSFSKAPRYNHHITLPLARPGGLREAIKLIKDSIEYLRKIY